MAKGLNSKLLVFYLLILIGTIIIFPLSLPLTGADNDSVPAGYGTIKGAVEDATNGLPLVNFTVALEREFLRDISTTTNESGEYELIIPEGQYILRIYDRLGFIIFRHEFNLTEGQTLLRDFVLDSHDIARSHVYGKIINVFTYTPLTDAELKFYRTTIAGEMGLYLKSETDGEGKYSIHLPAGEYEFEVWSVDEKIHSEKFTLNYGEEKEINLVLQKPTRTFTIQNILRLIQLEWLNIILIFVILIFGILGNVAVDRAFDSFEKQFKGKPGRFLDLPIVRFIERVVKWNILIIVLIFTIFFLAQILDVVTILWDPIANSVGSIYTVILLIIIMRVSLMIWKQFIEYIKGGKKGAIPKTILSSRMITIIDIIGKYLLIFSFLFGILITVLAALGMSDIIIGGFIGGISKNIGFIIFIISVVVITYVVVRFLSSFFQDMKYRSTRFRPEMIEIASKGIKYFIYGIILMIIIFTILSAAGLGDIGQTIIIVFSLIIGLVVSMAATGSIGNILSGLVIMAFKPFEEGDWVIIGEKHTGQIIEMNIMFTKMRDWDNEIIEIPNNLVLSTGIVNWTTSGNKGGFAVDIDVSISYEIPAQQVIELMIASCEGIPHIIEYPKPNVIITEFLNYAIGYKLRAYIESPQIRFTARTNIMINMQRKFTEAGVEILSPEFFVRRSDKIPTVKEIKGRMRKIKKFESPATPTIPKKS